MRMTLVAAAIVAAILAAPARAADCSAAVKTMIVEHLDVDAKKVVPQAKLADDLGADDLDTVELVMAAEEEFDIEIPDEVAEKIVTVGDLTRVANERARKGCD